MKTNLKRLLYKSLINSEFLITSNENISNNHYTVKNQSKLNRNFFFYVRTRLCLKSHKTIFKDFNFSEK